MDLHSEDVLNNVLKDLGYHATPAPGLYRKHIKQGRKIIYSGNPKQIRRWVREKLGIAPPKRETCEDIETITHLLQPFFKRILRVPIKDKRPPVLLSARGKPPVDIPTKTFLTLKRKGIITLTNRIRTYNHWYDEYILTEET